MMDKNESFSAKSLFILGEMNWTLVYYYELVVWTVCYIISIEGKYHELLA